MPVNSHGADLDHILMVEVAFQARQRGLLLSFYKSNNYFNICFVTAHPWRIQYSCRVCANVCETQLFSVVEDSGFVKLLNKMEPRYNIPS